MANSDEILWRLFEVQKESLQSVGRAQSRYVTSLLAFLALLWGWHFMRPEQLTVQLWGASLQASGLWVIAPAVLTILCLGLIGAMNIMGPVWKRFCARADAVGQVFWWTDVDTNKNLIDYLMFLSPRLERPTQPDKPPPPGRKFDLTLFSYPLVLAIATASTLLADYEGSSLEFKIYVCGCAGLQVLFSIRICWKATCRFLGIRKEQTEF